jgi:hypothetical protein
MRVKALQYMYYARREYHVGDEYDMDDREEAEARLLQTLGKIQILDRKLEAQKKIVEAPSYRAAELKAEPEPPSAEPMRAEDSALTGPRRYYRRRDMKAEK